MNKMVLDQDINVSANANYSITKSVKDHPGGGKYNIKINSDGIIDISAFVYIEGKLNISGGGQLTIRSGDTLIVEGKATFSGGAKLTIAEKAVLIVNGKLDMSGGTQVELHGNIYVNGQAKLSNGTIFGNGSFQSTDKTKLSGGASVFGQTAWNSTPCNPCKYGLGNALPIVLKTFKAKLTTKSNHLATIEWTTVSEINSNYFILEHSVNGSPFNIIAKIAGAGNSYKELKYKKEVILNERGIHYFKLTQVDFDGKSEVFPEIYLKIEQEKEESFSKDELYTYPNPSNGDNISLNINKISAGNYTVYIFDSRGNKVFQDEFIIKDTQSYFVENLTNGQHLSRGIYFLSIQNSLTQLSHKLIVY